METARNLRLKNSFKKLFNQVNPTLIDTACTSFGSDATLVSKATFVNTFNESLDKAMNASATNSKSPQKQPATAVIPINKKEADSLIKKLDNALLKQGISPLAAFKKADADGNGVIVVTELKSAI